MWKWKVNFQIEPKTNQWSSRRWPHDHQKVTCRWSQDSLSSGGDRQEPRRSPLALRTIVGGTLAGHRPKIWSFPEKIDRWPNSLPAAAVRCPLADFTTWFKVKKSADELPISKIGMRQKSGSHRLIYVVLRRRLNLNWLVFVLLCICISWIKTMNN